MPKTVKMALKAIYQTEPTLVFDGDVPPAELVRQAMIDTILVDGDNGEIIATTDNSATARFTRAGETIDVVYEWEVLEVKDGLPENYG